MGEISGDISSLLPVEINRYIDPFCGSMKTFIDLNSSLKLPRPLLSDPDHRLIEIYEYIKSMPEEFYRAIENSYRGRTKGALLALRKRYREIMGKGTMEEAATYLQINILNAMRNTNQGILRILRNASSIDKNLEFPTETDIVEFSRMLQKTEISKGGYEAVRDALSPKDLIFLNIREDGNRKSANNLRIEHERQFKKFINDAEKFPSRNIKTIVKIPVKSKLKNNTFIRDNSRLSKVILKENKNYEIWKNF